MSAVVPFEQQNSSEPQHGEFAGRNGAPTLCRRIIQDHQRSHFDCIVKTGGPYCTVFQHVFCGLFGGVDRLGMLFWRSAIDSSNFAAQTFGSRTLTHQESIA
ncbi:hypothetical protein Rcae01_05900 [Novipirellula caenicola]|uniref:Uncharacterized protein n=1 Tax=Novipirellula caenicola TaxID=1536901 RepID=A0ABP9VZ38_9BACT